MEKETHNVFMSMNTAKHKTERHKKQSKQNATENNQETKLREEKNWTIEEHSVKPQHRD